MKGMYGKGLILLIAGGAGLAEHITSGRGSYPICAAIFGIGLVMIAGSYVE